MTISRLSLIPAALACVLPVMAAAQSNGVGIISISTSSAQSDQGQPAQTDLDDPAVKAAAQGQIPLTPAMIRDLARRFHKNQSAGEDAVAAPDDPCF